MIIVSQDRDKAINSNKTLNIYINCETINVEYPYEDGWANLGRYKTKERAKEVFEEIMTRHANWENIQVGQPDGICSPVYYMPKE